MHECLLKALEYVIALVPTEDSLRIYWEQLEYFLEILRASIEDSLDISHS